MILGGVFLQAGSYLLIGLLFFLGVGGLFFAAGSRAKKRLKIQFPPPGELVDIGGARLHLQRFGSGSPVVVIDSGQGDFSLSWAHVLPEIAQFTSVVSYDRAGLGWSDLSPHARTTGNMVDELRRLLTNSGIEGPYVLVGASLGGLNTRYFAHCYPSDVVGMVLVDSSHEDQFSPQPIQEALDRMAWMVPLMNSAMTLLVKSGLLALKPGLLPDLGGMLAKLPLSTQTAYRAVIAGDDRNIRTQAAEIRDLKQSHAELRAAQISSLGEIPLIVLMHGKTAPMMASAEVSELLEQTFAECQKRLAALSSNGRLVIAEESTHTIHLDQPDLVVDAIREVVEVSRERVQAAA